MTIKEALAVRDSFNRVNGNYSEDDLFIYTEAMRFLISETADPDYMFELGVIYYENKYYDLALKYYEMCVAYDETHIGALGGLGYIWYYGCLGRRDYKKAFEYYFRAAKCGSIIAEYKVADMYRNGFYVEKDFDRFKSIIENLYMELNGTFNVCDPLPEICVRLAAICESEGRINDAVSLLRQGKSKLSSRIGYDPFFGNFSIMESLIKGLYRLTDFDYNRFDLYDLYYLLEKPVKVCYEYKGRYFTIESVREDDGSVSVCYNGKWYHSFTDALMKTKIDGHAVTLDAWKMKGFEVKK